MKKNSNPVQEILLMQNTRFLVRTWLEQKDVFEKKYSTSGDQLKEACWNGLVTDILPECFDPGFRDQLYLWHINDAVEFISLNYGTTSPEQDKRLSLDPHVFMSLQGFN